MICFLTSSHCVADAPDLNPANGFLEELRACLPNPCRVLFVCSDPDHFSFTDRIADESRHSFSLAGFTFSSYHILDRRTADCTAQWVGQADLIILAGGHAPTQNRFLTEINLRKHLSNYNGVVLAISAGTMNSADLVYAQPEEPGETSPTYQKFLPGLGLTQTMLLPHYQMTKHNQVDGLRLYEDITLPDSMGRCFYALVDGSFLLRRGKQEELRGEVYRIQDGALTQISQTGDIIEL